MKQTQTKMNLAEFKDFMEERREWSDRCCHQVSRHHIREDESSLVVKFITTNEYLWVKYILNMEEDGTLAIDATYNTLKTLKTSACGCLAWVI